jgi:hypothetical protein
MDVFAQQYLRMGAPQELYRFLTLSFSELQVTFGEVVGLRIAIPRLIPMGKAA